jgi:RNA polymerase-binding transcription factor DksA
MATPKKAATSTKAASAKKSAPAKKPATAKSAPAKKQAASKKEAPATKAPATKSTAKKATAKKEAPAAKKTPAKKTPAAKTPAKQAATSTKAVPAKSAPAKKAAPAKTAAPAKKAAPTSVKKAAPTKAAAAKRPTSTSTTPSLLSNAQYERVEIPAPKGRSKDGIAYTKDFDLQWLKQQRQELIERRASELARATRLEDEATSIIEDGEMGDVQFDDEGGEGDTMVVQRDLDRVLSSQARQTVLDIDAALARIEEGTYGYSSVSGLPIPRERLEAIPETTVLAAEKVSGVGSL